MQSSRTKNGLGFISMRERLRLVGGRISIRSQPFAGTQIDIVVPT
jgi:signal transduction histidine kinase